MPATLGRQTRHRTDALDEHAVRHVSKFDWAYLRLFCWPCRSISGSRMPRQDCPDARKFTIRGDGAGGSGQEDTHRSGFWDGGCCFVAVTAWMMAAYRRCHCGECNPAAVTRWAARLLVRALPRRPAGGGG